MPASFAQKKLLNEIQRLSCLIHYAEIDLDTASIRFITLVGKSPSLYTVDALLSSLPRRMKISPLTIDSIVHADDASKNAAASDDLKRQTNQLIEETTRLSSGLSASRATMQLLLHRAVMALIVNSDVEYAKRLLEFVPVEHGYYDVVLAFTKGKSSGA